MAHEVQHSRDALGTATGRSEALLGACERLMELIARGVSKRLTRPASTWSSRWPHRWTSHASFHGVWFLNN
jgi:hypothetical protein